MSEFCLDGGWSEGSPSLVVNGDSRDVSVASGGPLTVVVSGFLFLAAEGGHGAEGAESPAARALRLIDEEGFRWLGRAGGDFALVVHDAARRAFTLVKNVAGTRPIFFRRTDGGCAIACCYSALEADGPRREDLADPGEVRRFLEALFSEPTKTLRRDIETVAPGCVVTLTEHSRDVASYWSPAEVATVSEVSMAEAASGLRDVIAEVVADVVASCGDGLAVHLTPGLDSTILAGLAVNACREHSVDVTTGYTWSPEPADGVEATTDQRLIAEAADALGLQLSWQPTEHNNTAESLILDPLADPTTSTLASELATMRRASRDGIHTIICGWGGDELASYNGRHRRAMSVKGRLNNARRRARRVVRAARTGRTTRGFTSRKFGSVAGSKRPIGSSARQTQAALLNSGHIGERTDAWSVVGASFGVRHVYPLLDRRVLDYVFSLDEKYFVEHRTLMREVGRTLIPESVRVNTDKSDAARSARSLFEIEQIVGFLRDVGIDEVIDPDRAHLIDVKQLARAIEGPRVDKPGKMMRALQLGAKREQLQRFVEFGETPIESSVSATEPRRRRP